MMLPIDFETTTFPIKPKYIEDETTMLARWMVFGFHGPLDKPYTEQMVDVTGPNGEDIFTRVPSTLAEKIIDARNRFVDEILEILNDV